MQYSKISKGLLPVCLIAQNISPYVLNLARSIKQTIEMHCAGDHDARVAAAAEEAGLQLRPRNVRVFDEVVDIVNFDLVIVLDHFAHTEVRQ